MNNSPRFSYNGTLNALLYGDTEFGMSGMEPRYDDLVLTAHTEWELMHKNLRSEKQHTCWIRDIAAFNHIERGYAFDKVMRLSPIGLWAAASVARGGTWTQEGVLNFASKIGLPARPKLKQMYS